MRRSSQRVSFACSLLPFGRLPLSHCPQGENSHQANTRCSQDGSTYADQTCECGAAFAALEIGYGVTHQATTGPSHDDRQKG